MKILMLLEQHYPSDIRVEKEARTLAKAGHEVLLLCPNLKGAPADEIVGDLKVHRVPPPTGFLQTIWAYSRFALDHVHPYWRKQLDNAVRRESPQALHIHDLPMVKTGLSVARAYSIPIVADLHENYPAALQAWDIQFDLRRKVARLVGRWGQLQRYCLQNANRVIAVVDEGKEHYVKVGSIPPEKVTVVMNTEDTAYFSSLPVNPEIVRKYQPSFVISYIGGLGYHRGIHTAISAMPQILKQIPNARLLLVGTGPNEAELKQLAKTCGVEQAVDFAGWQPFSLIPSYFAASSICVIPHIASDHTNTTIPHKLFQCMAIGKPVIVSSAKPLERIVKETGAGLVYPSGDVTRLAEAVLTMYLEPSLAETCGNAGRKAAETKYDWKADGQRLVAMYGDLS